MPDMEFRKTHDDLALEGYLEEASFWGILRGLAGRKGVEWADPGSC